MRIGGGSVTYGIYQLINAPIRPFHNTPLNYMAASIIEQSKKYCPSFVEFIVS